MSAVRKSLVGLAIGLGLFVLALGALVSGPAPSYADTVPTPVAAQAGSGSSGWLAVTFFDGDAEVASGASVAAQLPGYDSLDIQYVLDVGTENTTTLTLQWSNDNTNWSDGPVIVNAATADADGMVQVANMGRYTRIYNTLTNANPLTITVKAIAKP